MTPQVDASTQTVENMSQESIAVVESTKELTKNIETCHSNRLGGGGELK